ncbi:hypothetical protein AB0M95_39825 [Sphaerisporangium sp. NPDC051017]|uniref:hypothetical protein n=1 Tax=Sphaerisporangium sp. NPDC051017 TaxID=3154636 RepID=UPI00344A6BF5
MLFATSSVDPTNLNPSLIELSWPMLSWAPLCGVLAGTLPAFLTPPPELSHVPAGVLPEKVAA